MKTEKMSIHNQVQPLLLVLFVVLFLSITGTVLLTSTTYSLKSNEKNTAVQAEFYAAEGALDLVLDDITHTPSLYNNLQTMGINSEREMFKTSYPKDFKKIGNDTMSVKLKKVE